MKNVIALTTAILASVGRAAWDVDMPRLIDAIAQVESDRGATSSNVYQLRPIYVADVERIYRLKTDLAFYEIANDERASRAMMLAYWAHYGALYEKKTGKPVTAEVLARIHNGGPNGWEKRATLSYWERVRRHYETKGAK